MSARHDVEEATLRNWANLGYITKTRINNQMYLDEESFIAYLEAHKIEGLQADYLAKIIEEKKLERDFAISKFDDMLYVLKTLKECEPLFQIIIYELSLFIIDPERREIFYSISMGESIARVAKRHRITYDRALKIYSSLLEGLKNKKRFLAIYRKQAIEYRLSYLSNHRVTSQRSGELLRIPISKVADTRMVKILQMQGILTIRQLLVEVSAKGWNSLLEMRGVGNTSYIHLLSKLRELGISDARMENILAPYLKGKSSVER